MFERLGRHGSGDLVRKARAIPCTRHFITSLNSAFGGKLLQRAADSGVGNAISEL